MPARFDAKGAPHDDLLLMRRQTAHFARVLNDLSDRDLRADAEQRKIVAKISIEARKLALLVKSFREPLNEEEESFDAEVDYTASLPIHALRHLFHHSALHLNVEFRDLGDAQWPQAMELPRTRSRSLLRATNALASNGPSAD